MCVLIGARIRAVLRDSNQGVYGWIRDAPARTSFPIMLNYGTVRCAQGAEFQFSCVVCAILRTLTR
jgi:hypothetical protein